MKTLLLCAGVATVQEGDEVEIAIGYNGGHRSNTLNYFHVRYACGAAAAEQNTFRRVGPTNKDTITCNPPCKQLTVQDIVTVDGAPATAANYPVDATQSNRDGYVSVWLKCVDIVADSPNHSVCLLLWRYKVKFKIPAIQGAGDARKCTFALVEGWWENQKWYCCVRVVGESTTASCILLGCSNFQQQTANLLYIRPWLGCRLGFWHPTSECTSPSSGAAPATSQSGRHLRLHRSKLQQGCSGLHVFGRLYLGPTCARSQHSKRFTEHARVS